ncbi:MAG TPA: M24 family metallopeptidase [Spirochaetia bacterium]|nr:M24 family metallopeptidase [Spirochaetia bacterium]
MLDIAKPRAAMQELGLSAWLLVNIFHRDEIADLVLEVPAGRTNTRPWVCVLFPDKEPVKIIHRIEASILDHVPGKAHLYSTREEYTAALSRSLPRTGMVAADFSQTIPVASFLDHGTAMAAEACGCTLVSAESLIARCLGTLDAEGLRTHADASAVLYSSIKDAWGLVKDRLGSTRPGRDTLHEGELRDLISRRFSDAGLVSDGTPMVGAGAHSSDPHYSTPGDGAAVKAGDVIQFDIWAKKSTPGAVYADISWVGIAAREPTAEQQRAFDAITAAREEAITVLSQGLSQGKGVRGADVDAAARGKLVQLGYGDFLRHRTGHSIGSRVHGFGVNLDCVEFPDARLLPEGACFSIEPGVYLPQFGMRTEIDCVIRGGKLEVTGGDRQRSLLVLG